MELRNRYPWVSHKLLRSMAGNAAAAGVDMAEEQGGMLEGPAGAEVGAEVEAADAAGGVWIVLSNGAAQDPVLWAVSCGVWSCGAVHSA